MYGSTEVVVDGGVESFVVKSKCMGAVADIAGVKGCNVVNVEGAAVGMCGCTTVARTSVGGLIKDGSVVVVRVCRNCCCGSGG